MEEGFTTTSTMSAPMVFATTFGAAPGGPEEL